MLTNEYFGIKIQINNEFDMMFENVSISITVPGHLRNKGLSIQHVFFLISIR